MGLKTYLTAKKNRAVFKYAHLKLMFSSKLHSLQDQTLGRVRHLKDKAVSKFHLSQSSHGEKFRVASKQLVEELATIDFTMDHDLPLKDQKIFSEVIVNPASETIHERFNWTDNLPEGARAVSITIKQGEIVEKCYLDKEGELISVKRD